MEALHKPPNDVAGEAGKDLIVMVESDAGMSGGWKDSGSSSSAEGENSSDLLSMVGSAWNNYECELMGENVEGVEQSPASFLVGYREDLY